MIHKILSPLWLVRQVFTLYCCDAPPAPDTSAIAASNERASQLAYQNAQDNLAFQKQQYADLKPALEQQLQAGSDASKLQMDIAKDNQDHANEQWNDYQTTYKPVEQKVAQEAMDYGGQADQTQQAGTAMSNMKAQFGAQRDQTNRAMTASGVNPNSGKFAAINAQSDIAEAAQTAAAGTAAATGARDKGMAMRTGVANFGRNMPNTAMTAGGAAVGAGSAATQSAGAGIGSGIGMGGMVGGAYGMNMNAAQMAIQGNLGLGQLQNGAYQTQAGVAGSNAQGLGAAVGAVGTIAVVI